MSCVSTANKAIRIAIVGPGRSGKDEAAEYLRKFGFRYEKSTSSVIWPHAAKLLGQSLDEAWETRHKYRNTWYAIGNNLRDRDPAALVREVLKTGNIVVGVRDGVEMKTARDEGLVDLVIWIDRDVPEDPTLTFGKELADVIIPNHEGLAEFHKRLDRFARTLRPSWDSPPKWEVEPAEYVAMHEQYPPFDARKPKPFLAPALESVADVIANGFPAFGEWMVDGHIIKTAGTDGANAMPSQPPAPPAKPPLPSLGGVPRDQLTIYLSGPMTGYPDYNYPAFDAAANALRHRGWRVISPADFAAKTDVPWQECLQRDLTILGYCDVIVTLVGWETSRGATLETDVARRLGKEVLTLADILNLD